mgnify:CR=1 FL=1
MSVFSLSNLKKTWYYLQKNGIRNAVWAVLERIGQEQEVYTWQEPEEKTLSFQREHCASLRISIVVPAYRTKKEHLEAMLNSVSKQSYPHWELIVADAGGTAESVQTWAKRTESVCGKQQMHQILQNGRIRASCSVPFPKTKEFPLIRTQELNLQRETRWGCWITTIC